MKTDAQCGHWGKTVSVLENGYSESQATPEYRKTSAIMVLCPEKNT